MPTQMSFRKNVYVCALLVLKIISHNHTLIRTRFLHIGTKASRRSPVVLSTPETAATTETATPKEVSFVSIYAPIVTQSVKRVSILFETARGELLTLAMIMAITTHAAGHRISKVISIQGSLFITPTIAFRSQKTDIRRSTSR